MQFNDTTNKNGMIQKFELLTRQPDGTVTGDLLKQVTGLINSGFDNIMPLLLSYSDHIRWDDTNHTSHRQTGTINLVSGQQDYTLSNDEDSLAILNLTDVRVLESASATEYQTLDKMTIDDERALDAMSPNPSVTGVPTHWLEVNNTLFLYPKPNYSATNGIRLFYEREQYRFLSTDTDKKPGIPTPFHELPVLYAALDWTLVNRTNDSNLISRLEAKIAKQERNIKVMMTRKHPTKTKLTMSRKNFR